MGRNKQVHRLGGPFICSHFHQHVGKTQDTSGFGLCVGATKLAVTGTVRRTCYSCITDDRGSDESRGGEAEGPVGLGE